MDKFDKMFSAVPFIAAHGRVPNDFMGEQHWRFSLVRKPADNDDVLETMPIEWCDARKAAQVYFENDIDHDVIFVLPLNEEL